MTASPTAAWVWRQVIEATPWGRKPRHLLHDRDRVYSRDFGRRLQRIGIDDIITPIHAPAANAIVERVIGTLRRECLDFVIPLNERHLKRTLQEWGNHYNRGRPHSTLGPGLPEPTQDEVPASGHKHKLPAGFRTAKTSVLGGLHHQYRLVKEAA